MKKIIKHSFALLMMGTAFTSIAKTVDESTARNVGANFLISDGVSGVQNSSDLSSVYTATTIVNGAAITDYYVFNINGGNGFVMVAGDDNIIPILAYSRQGAFNNTNISPSTKDWIDGYKNQITAAIINNVPAKAGTAAKWADLQTAANHAGARSTSTGVDSLVMTKWDQDGRGLTGTVSTVKYNAYCPNTSTTGGLSVTGCVATAMAQLMKYWNWPTAGCGSHSYFDAYSSSEGMGSNTTNTADFGNTAYDWAGMPLTSSSAAIATLMYHAGVSVNMSYSAHESGSYVTLPETAGVNCAEYALKTYFHYKSSLHHVLRYGLDEGTLGTYYEGQDYVYLSGLVNIDSMAEAAWVTMLQTELNAGRPMLYEGQGLIGGHCWICDGWETTDDMFHFNWGWSGVNDGFYTLEALDPPAAGSSPGGGAGNFNYDQGVIMGVEPDSFASNTGNIALAAHLNTTTSSPMEYGTPFTITTQVLNSGSATFTGNFYVAVYDSAGNFVGTSDTVSGTSISAAGVSTSMTFSLTTGANLMIPVSYHSLRLLYNATGSSTWAPVANKDSLINYTIMDVLNDTDIVLYDSLSVGSHNIRQGSSLTVSTTIGNQNENSTNFSGTIQAVLINTSTGASFIVQSHSSESIVAYGSPITLSFTNSDVSVPTGVYALEIQHQYGGSGSFFTTSSDFFVNPILVTVYNTTTGVPLVAATNDVFVYPNPANDVINVLVQNVNVTGISVMDIAGRTVKTLGGSNQPLISLSVSDLAAGDYFVQVQTTTGVVTKKIVITK